MFVHHCFWEHDTRNGLRVTTPYEDKTMLNKMLGSRSVTAGKLFKQLESVIAKRRLDENYYVAMYTIGKYAKIEEEAKQEDLRPIGRCDLDRDY
jgi:hypothetical protein